jgi:hypothetical protein
MNTKFLRIILSTLVVTALSVFTNVNAQNYKWAIKGSGTGTEVIYAVASDIFGNTVVTGQFNSSTMKIGNGTTTLTLTNSNSGKYDVFVVKLNSSGTPLWAKSEGGPGDDGGTAIKLDDSGNVYVAGSFQSTSTSTGPAVFGSKNLYSAGSSDIFIAKYDYLGNLVWVKSFARIHETNLKKQGMLALTFANPSDYDLIQEDDNFDIIGLTTFAEGTPLTLVAHHKDGSHSNITVNHTYNNQQIEWFKAGGAMNIIRANNAN